MSKKLGILILAAGFGERIKSVWNGPKGLIKYRGKTIIEHLLAEIEQISGETEIVLLSNERDYRDYQELLSRISQKVRLVSNGVRVKSKLVGAVTDMELGFQQFSKSDVLVVPCDTLLRNAFKLSEFVDFAKNNDGVSVVVHKEQKEIIRGRFGNVNVEKGRVVEFVEKPDEPISDLAETAIYYYPESEIGSAREYLDQGGNAENPGRLISYLLEKKNPVYVFRVDPGMIDVGKPRDYREISEDDGKM